jgi:hypothetical protein
MAATNRQRKWRRRRVKNLAPWKDAVGASVRDVQQKLELAQQRVTDARKKKDDAAKEKNDKQVQSAVANAKISEITIDLNTKESERSGAITGLVAFVGTRQLSGRAQMISQPSNLANGQWRTP